MKRLYAISKLITLLPILLMIGCEFSTTILTDDLYEIRIINRTGETVKIKWDDDSYRYLDEDDVMIIASVDFGYHELEWIWDSDHGHVKTAKSYKIKVDADFEVVLQEDYEGGLIIID